MNTLLFPFILVFMFVFDFGFLFILHTAYYNHPEASVNVIMLT